MTRLIHAASSAVIALAAAGAFFSSAANAQPLAWADPSYRPASLFDQVLRDRNPGPVEETTASEPSEVPAHLRRQVVQYPAGEAPGTIVIDTAHTYLYFVLGGGRAVRYGIGVGREGFTWSGVQTISRKAEWPDWYPPAEMVARQPYLPRMMAGGPGNPLGARAMYLGNSVYRIHGTNAPATIGGHVSSGCIRMLNEDVVDLYGRANVGTKVVVLPGGSRHEQNIARTRTAPVASVVPSRSIDRTSMSSTSLRGGGLY